ncbi:sulfurase [Bacillaceae bacterium JMAK1]|nr:sulfurase [Bacillaceae bacterium JMAK1]
MTIRSLAVGRPQLMTSKQDRTITTGIKKTTIKEVELELSGFHNDDVGNKKNHGGVDRAVCFYPFEHYAMWEHEHGKTLPFPAFGENLTVSTMLESDVCIGDVYRIGEAIVEISQGRVPCATINLYTSSSQLLARFIETGYTGYFGRVLQRGKITDQSSIALLQRDDFKVSVLHATRTLFLGEDVTEMKMIQSIPSLSKEWKNRFEKKLLKKS